MLKKIGVATLSCIMLFGTTGAAVDEQSTEVPEIREHQSNTIQIQTDEEKQAAADREERKERKEELQASVVLETEVVEYETRTIEDDSLPAGVEVVAREGEDGEKTMYRSYVERIQADGNKTMVPVTHSNITEASVSKIVLQGTDDTEISAMSDKAVAAEAERAQEREAEARAEREAEAEEAAERAREAAEAEANAETDGSSDAGSSSSSGSSGSSSSNSSSGNSSSGGTPSVDTSGSAAAMKAQVSAGQVTTPAQNRAYAKAILSPADFAAADALVKRESEWITTAANPNSSAYGVPQSLPGTKMASAGSDWRTNGMTQFDWMITYVEGRYGSFQNALAHSHRVGWY